MIPPADLIRFGDWDWYKTLYLERWWPYFRVYALHRIALMYLDESARARDAPRDLMPHVHDQAGHKRVVAVSVGINPTEVIVGIPARVDWDQVAPSLRILGAVI